MDGSEPSAIHHTVQIAGLPNGIESWDSNHESCDTSNYLLGKQPSTRSTDLISN